MNLRASTNNNIYMYNKPDYSSWQPQAIINNQIRSNEGIKSNWQYRQYMTNNASYIMKYNTQEAIYESGNNPYTLVNNEPAQKTPYLYNNIQQNAEPPVSYGESDLKRLYLEKERIQARLIAPNFSTNF